jgi:hypothetical protein
VTVTQQLAARVRAADAQLSPDLPLVAASAQIAARLNVPQRTVLAVLRGYHLTVSGQNGGTS